MCRYFKYKMKKENKIPIETPTVISKNTKKIWSTYFQVQVPSVSPNIKKYENLAT